MTLPESYLESIVNWNRRRYSLEIDPDTVLHATGVHPAIISTLRAFCPPGSKVLLQTPSYNGFYTDIRVVGVVAEESPLRLVNGRYGMDFEDLERRIDHDTHALILCNPQNPTGNVWSRSDLTTLSEICTRRRVVVLADEIHCDFVTRGHTYIPYASLDDEAIVRNSITYKSVSKSFNLSAMKCAYLFSTNPDYLARIRGAGQHQQSMNTLGVIAAQTAYNECEDWLDQLIAYIDGTHELVESMVRSTVPQVGVVKPEGTYLAWLDVSDALDRIDAEDTAAASEQTTPETVLQRYLVEHANIHINPGSSYGLGGSGHMRMNIATSRQLVELALGNMAAALARA
jgi:cystathionine beta-lyase